MIASRACWITEAPPVRAAEWTTETHCLLSPHGVPCWRDRCFWLAAILSCVFNAGAFGVVYLFTIFWQPEPPFLVAYGDSDRVGLPLGALGVEERVYRQGDSNTVGGDNGNGPIEAPPVIPPPGPERAPAPIEPVAERPPAPLPLPVQAVEMETPEPAVALEEPAALPAPPAVPPGPPREAPRAGPAVVRNLPGPPGGARLPVGTPGQGGTAGSPDGLRLISKGQQSYPRDAETRGLQGRVVVHVRIAKTGHVVEAKLHATSGHAVLDHDAVSHARTLRFAPLASETHALYPVSYTLTR